ncbi:unnamed protein product, partial [Prorocentrum cordatum]
ASSPASSSQTPSRPPPVQRTGRASSRTRPVQLARRASPSTTSGLSTSARPSVSGGPPAWPWSTTDPASAASFRHAGRPRQSR